jgi:hypothetical protein
VKNQNSVWVAIIEKAWAKLHGGYHRIEFLNPNETLRDLTGAPSFEYKIEETGTLELIIDGFYQKYVMTAHCKIQE